MSKHLGRKRKNYSKVKKIFDLTNIQNISNNLQFFTQNQDSSKNNIFSYINSCIYCRTKIHKELILKCFVCKEISCQSCAEMFYSKYGKILIKENFLCRRCLLQNSKIS